MNNHCSTKILWQKDASFTSDLTGILNSRKRQQQENIYDTVKDIIQTVKKDGDNALFRYSKKFDHISMDIESLKIPRDAIRKAYQDCTRHGLETLRFAAERIGSFHQKVRPNDTLYQDELGVTLGLQWTPVDSAGLYVPGGSASYPSSVLMSAIAAQLAGVKRVVMVVPTPRGYINPYVLVAADIANIKEIYRVGGAQAIAALAYGTESISPVCKIVGPGNAYVTEAKRQVFGQVGIDMLAGPSEILVVADQDANPRWNAADLLSQAEHDTYAQSILITDSKTLAMEVQHHIKDLLPRLPRRDIARYSWENFGAILVVENLSSAISIIDAIAPEHLQLAIQDAENYATKISNAGAIFLGYFTPEAIGDYVGGPSHVLPTGSTAKYASGLSVMDFMKRTTLLKCTQDNVQILGKNAAMLAEIEQLKCHQISVEKRLYSNKF